MPTLTRDEIEKHQIYRDSHETVSQNVAPLPMKRLMKVPYRSMDENRALIVRALHTAQFPLSRLEICRRIGRKKTPHLNALIEDMTADGTLIKMQHIRPNGVVMFTYILAAAE